MASSLEQLISELGDGEIDKEFFNTIVEELVELEGGLGMKALRAVIMANVRGGCATKKLAVTRLIEGAAHCLPTKQRTEVLQTMAAGWEDLEEDVLKEVLRALVKLTDPTSPWDLSPIRSQVAKVAGSDSPGLSLSAKSLLSTIG